MFLLFNIVCGLCESLRVAIPRVWGSRVLTFPPQATQNQYHFNCFYYISLTFTINLLNLIMNQQICLLSIRI